MNPAYGGDLSNMQANKHIGYGNSVPLRTTAGGSTAATSNLGNKKASSGHDDVGSGQETRSSRAKDNVAAMIAGQQMRGP